MNINANKIYRNKNSFNTFFSNNNDYIVINNKNNAILYIYRNLPKYKYIKVIENNKNTSILVLPKNTSIGLKIGDVIIQADGKDIKTMDELNEIKNSHQIGDEMKVKVNRDGEERELTIVLGEQP